MIVVSKNHADFQLKDLQMKISVFAVHRPILLPGPPGPPGLPGPPGRGGRLQQPDRNG